MITEDSKKAIQLIKENYKGLEDFIITELSFRQKHGTITGTSREGVWNRLFKRIIPEKFAVENNVMLVDATGNISKEIDIVIFDKQYTPYLFHYGTIKIIPIEAVMVVVESKSSSVDNEKIRAWYESVERLKTDSKGIARILQSGKNATVNETRNTRPIRIFAGMTDKNNLDHFFDIQIIVDINKKILSIKIPDEDQSLDWWMEKLNTKDNGDQQTEEKEKKDKEERCERNLLKLTVKDNPILSLNLKLNQLLMLINNPMFFPHYSYAEMFNSPEDEM